MSRLKEGVTEEVALGRLPKWAQDRIRNLERDLAHLQEELRKSESQEPTRTGLGYDTRSAGEPGRWLPDQHVTFYLPDQQRPRDTWIQVMFEPARKSLRVMGSDGLIVKPGASNVVNLEVVD